MAFVSPCIKGKMGSTDYYLSKINASELISLARPASELDGWASMGIEERMQREPALKRIKDEIAPYVARSKDRFFGSIIVLVYKGEVHFESLVRDFKASVPHAYKSQSESIGFLTVNGGSLIVLDGQHRLLALQAVIKNEVPGDFAREVPGDEISVIFIHHEEDEKTRRIFNKLNRYAKPTSRGDNIITSEDDGYAIVTRMLLRDGAPLGMSDAKGDSSVNYTSNTLAARSTKLTTLGTVYETVRLTLQHEGLPSFDEKLNIVRPSDEELDRAFEVMDQRWSAVLSGLQPYPEAVKNPSRLPEMRIDTAPSSLLFKPAAQVALFQGLALAKKRGLELDEAVRRANDVQWSMRDKIWENIIVTPSGTIMAHNDARENAAELTAYLIGRDVMSGEQIDALQESYSRANGGSKKLPEPVPDAR